MSRPAFSGVLVGPAIGTIRRWRAFGQREIAHRLRCDGPRAADWLRGCGVTHAAMESTGLYWKPVWHVLEGSFELLLVNAQHVKAIPGKKTDRRDSVWLAELLQHGLLKSSFVPPAPIRELRELTRYRVTPCQECNRIANWIQKVLEDANVKLESVLAERPERPHQQGASGKKQTYAGPPRPEG